MCYRILKIPTEILNLDKYALLHIDCVMMCNLPYLSEDCFYHTHLCSFYNQGISFPQL